VKPANMLLSVRSGAGGPDHVYLSDFGISKQSLASAGITSTGQFLGTLQYIAPEQVQGGPVDGRADQYALACAAFELLSGSPPFRGTEGIALAHAHLTEPPPQLTSQRAGLTAGTDLVMAKAMAKSPADRYPTCRAFADALREALGLGAPDPGLAPGPAAGRPMAVDQPARQQADLPRRPFLRQEPGNQPAVSATPAQTADPALGGPTWPGHSADYGAPDQAPAVWPSGEPQRRRWWRSRGALAAGCAVVLAVAGIAAGVLRSSGGGGGGGSERPAVLPAISLPGCTTALAKAARLSSVSSSSVQLTGQPFGVRVTRDGHWLVTEGDALAVFSKGSGTAPALLRSIPVTGAQMKGAAITASGTYLVAASGSGAEVINVAQAVRGGASPVAGKLSSPGGTGAVEVEMSAGDDFAFVTLQDSDKMAVFNFKQALASGFTKSGFIGFVPFNAEPVGIAQSPDGRWLYVVSILEGISNPGQGQLSIISTHAAETAPGASAVTRRVSAGCNPARVILSDSGRDVWVSARQSNSLLCFSAARLQNGSANAVIARVAVGANPIGLALVKDGTRIVVADSNQSGLPGAQSTLAVVNIADALAGKPALLGYIQTGEVPREFAVAAGGRTLLVTDNRGGELQAVRLAAVP
jgi:DNA-binding beta-propeller fold protein YncE